MSILENFPECKCIVKVEMSGTTTVPGIGIANTGSTTDDMEMYGLPTRPYDMKKYPDGTVIVDPWTFYEENSKTAKIGDVIIKGSDRYKIVNMVDYLWIEGFVMYLTTGVRYG